ncbi:bifunctional methylenetetrahydrofolate dehydrogenase/methenyltetrahydrofolate cyclohydrolase FolD [Niveispirillum irakense]|uniref:bifunctional methylenetetrahydrofolate dehydrogenase/methenyltetrahydrofolate cyclohydrolase FolD n=1 Tax=Niveispirillum irakense TaxID=34011 RepID=UPI0003FD06A6|nr:bifunctional methylenetetrahydrofolate dehydrogenase/methenyltetrahydrofolate cyclohydrolase FolD [Niveispirillum irakense]
MAEARIIDGKGFAASLRARIAVAVEDLRTRHALVPGLAVVLVGEDPASQIYVRNKGEQTREVGMHSVTHRLPVDTSQEGLLRLVNQLNQDPSIHGILVQLPLPGHIDTQAVLSAIDPAKDVDGFHVVNTGRLSVGLPALVPCTPLGCMMLLKDTLSDLRGMNAVVIGRSNIVGKPMAQLLLAADCTVTIAHSRTRDLPAVARQADILIAAVGRPEMVRGDWIKEGATVIDVGINRVPARDPAAAAAGKTRIVGDVAYAEAAAVAGAITPVPGGVGPMTIACLLSNTVTAACRAAGVAVPAGVGL